MPAPEIIGDYYADGAWYDAEYVHIGGDIPYYERVASEATGPVLELACGTGRLTIPMARAGAAVHGLDSAPGMVRRAEQKRAELSSEVRARLSFEVADMRSARLGRTYTDVVLAFNTLMHMLEDDDLEATLRTAWVHLAPRGLFHLDLHTPFPELLQRDPEGRFDPQQMVDARGRRYVVTENNQYDPRRQINTMRFYYQRVDRAGAPVGSEKMAVLRLRVLFPRELDHWLRLTGFEVIGDWDDFERKRLFSGAGGRRVVMARRRG